MIIHLLAFSAYPRGQFREIAGASLWGIEAAENDRLLDFRHHSIYNVSAVATPIRNPKTENLTFRISPGDKALLESAITHVPGTDLTGFVLTPALNVSVVFRP